MTHTRPVRILVGALAIVISLTAAHARAASFDCARARAPDERAICADRALNDADVRMTTMFGFLVGLFAMGSAGDMRDAQRTWLHQRQACGANTSCLHAAYARRIGELQAAYDHIDKPL